MQSNRGSTVNEVRQFHTQISQGYSGQDDSIPEVPRLPDSIGRNPVKTRNMKPQTQELDSPAVPEKDHKFIGTEPSQRPAQIPLRASSRQIASVPAIRIDDHSDQQSSRNDSWSSTVDSYETNATSLGSLESSGQWNSSTKRRTLELLVEDFDLAAPLEDGNKLESLEVVSDLLFSRVHLKTIFADPSSLLKFTSFLSAYRPQSISRLIYYLDATKALKAISFANATINGLVSLADQGLTAITTKTMNSELELKAEKAFNLIVEKDLPAYTTQLYLQVVKSNMARSFVGSQYPSSPDGPDGFAEVFCLTDPSRPDNPILFASEAFHQMTQYSMNYIIGRNCRFLQGPKTNSASVKRLGDAVKAERPHCEVILNYRRDGSPFMNLLMHAPLHDHLGKVRYFMGAQIDVSNIIDDSYELESLQQVIMQKNQLNNQTCQAEDEGKTDQFQELVETLDMQELGAVRAWEDRILQIYPESINNFDLPQSQRPGMLPRDRSYELLRGNRISNGGADAMLELYSHYLLVRPHPSLRILFASPSLSKPGILQSPIMDKIGGSSRVREELMLALSEGREVTAKVKWMVHADKEDQTRWIHFTPLVGSKGQIGVWMAILEEDDPQNIGKTSRFNTGKSGIRAASPIPEEPSDLEDEYTAPDVPRSKYGHRPHISWSGPEVAPELRSPTLNWHHESQGSSLFELTTDTTIPDDVEEFESLEERLRKKRLRDATRLVEQSTIPILKTYKSLAPDGFLKEEGM